MRFEMSRTRDIEAIYPLSPLQQGMLFHAIYGSGADHYLRQVSLPLRGKIDPVLLQAAWQEVVDRHSILRTGFVWQGVERPLQAVRRRIPVPWEVHDWRACPEGEWQERLDSFLAAERQRGFELAKPPLLRLALIRLAEERHQLVWTFHHLVLDGWSKALVIGEVQALYEARLRRRPLTLPPARPFRDYIGWLAEQEPEAAELYWRETLRGFTAPTPVVARNGSPRPAAETGGAHEQGEWRLLLSEETTSTLQSLARRHRVTLNTLVQGAWALLLSRYTGTDDVVFGTVVAGRPHELPGVEAMVGVFINTVPLRVRVPAGGSFYGLLQTLHSHQADLRQHEQSPLIEVQSWSDVPRGVALFESLYAFENYPVRGLLGEAATAVEGGEAVATLGTSYPLTLVVAPERRMRLQALFDVSLLAETEILALLGSLETLLDAIGHGGEELSALPVLGAAERHQLLVEWNDSLAHYPREAGIHELFGLQAERTPEAVALVFGAERLSYQELDARARRLGGRLRQLGVGPDSRVAICAGRSLDMVVGLLAILEAGGAYLPIDPANPEERLRFLLADSDVRVVVAEDRWADRFEDLGLPVVHLGGELPPDAPRSAAHRAPGVGAANLAYVSYTSGSTGLPKGVAVPHRAVARLVRNGGYARLDGEQLLLQLAPLAFDASTFEIWGSLLNGGCLVIAPPDFELRELGATLSRHGITTLWLTAGLFHLMVDEDLADLGSVRQLLAGGDVLSVPHVRRALAGLPGCRLINGYGPTEGTTFTCAYPMSQAEEVASSIPIGRPIHNTTVYILDRELRPMPFGRAGELCIGGDGLARYYLNRPDLTGLRFVPDPMSGESGARLYRTGDLARHFPDGRIEFLGRMDAQVKIRGFRIEPGEVEAVLARHEGVREVVVAARESASGRRLVAYFVAAAENPATEADLLALTRESLPDYMVPTAFVALSELPLNRNGKVDRRALPEPEAQHAEGEGSSPRDFLEQRLATIWSQVLRVERVGIEDDFFALGGDSILSIQIVARANQAGIRVTAKQLFENPTVARLAAVVGAALPALRGTQEVVTGPAPLTPIQRWFFEQEIPAPHHFNQAVLLESTAPLDTAALQRALEHLLVHHDALRLRFHRDRSGWRQEIAVPDGKAPLTRIDLAAVPEAGRGAILEAAASQLQASMDLAQGPLLRSAAFDLGPARSGRVLLAVHHLAIDGVSWRILLADLESAYAQARAGEPVELPAKTTSFKRWAERLPELARESCAPELAYWSTAARGTVPTLPVDFPQGINSVASTRVVTASLGKDETDALLLRVPEARRVRINDVLLTALVLSVADWSGQGKLLVDLEGHGREEIAADLDLSRTVGWFTALYPVLLGSGEAGALAGGPDLLATVKEQLRSIPRHGIGHGLLYYLGGEEAARALAALPRSEVSFNYLGQLDRVLSDVSPFREAPEAPGEMRGRGGLRLRRLDVGGRVSDGRLQMKWSYSANLYRRETIERLADGFLRRLRELISFCLEPGVPFYTPSDFPLAGIDRTTLHRLAGQGLRIADLYPLSHAQKGMLFHALASPESEIYFEQTSQLLRGDLDVPALRRAFALLVERHPVLRTAFLWEGLEEPLQAVIEGIEPPWQEEDVSGVPDAELGPWLDSFLAADRRRGFRLASAPLLRWTLIHLRPGEYYLVRSYHHLLLDGWSNAMLLAELLAAYTAFQEGREPQSPAPRPYRDYIAWLASLDRSGEKAYWQRQLQGFTRPNRLPRDRTPAAFAPVGLCDKQAAGLSAAATEDLQGLARRHGLTLNTLVHGAWSLLLGRYSGDEDLVYGATLSGRPPQLAGVESMVGLFINTLPVRVRISPLATLLPWLTELQEGQVELRQHESTPLVDVQRWTGFTAGQSLFETILVFENFPVDPSLRRSQESLAIAERRSTYSTNYPVALVVAPGRELRFEAAYQAEHLTAPMVGRMLQQLTALLASFAAAPEARLADLPLLTPAEGHQLRLEWNAPGEEPPRACLQTLFEAQVERDPGAMAVVCGVECPDLPRALPEVEPAGAPAARPGGGTGGAGGDLSRALDRSRGGNPRRAQGWRSVCSARSRCTP